MQSEACPHGKVKREGPDRPVNRPARTVLVMKHRSALALLITLAAGTTGAASAELVPIDWGPDGRFAREASLPATKFVELCGPLAAGSRIDWTFEATAPLNFNIHYHEGKDVRFPAKQDQVAKADGTLRVEVDQAYCWMWTNKSAKDARLKLTLKRNQAP